jgi:hypothetical protein
LKGGHCREIAAGDDGCGPARTGINRQRASGILGERPVLRAPLHDVHRQASIDSQK